MVYPVFRKNENSHSQRQLLEEEHRHQYFKMLNVYVIYKQLLSTRNLTRNHRKQEAAVLAMFYKSKRERITLT